jgi:hypothetical protein
VQSKPLRYAAALLILIVPYVGLVPTVVHFYGFRQTDTYGKEVSKQGLPEPRSAAYAGHTEEDRVELNR